MNVRILQTILNKEGVVRDLVDDMSMIDDTGEISNFLLDFNTELEDIKDTSMELFGKVSGETWRNFQSVGAFFVDIDEHLKVITKVINKSIDLNDTKELIERMLHAYCYAVYRYVPNEEGESSEMYEYAEDRELYKATEDLKLDDETKALLKTQEVIEAVEGFKQMWMEYNKQPDEVDYFKYTGTFYSDDDIIEEGATPEGRLEFDEEEEETDRLFEGLDSILDLVEEEK